ncbi:MAG: UbiA family prenyltransferase [Chitinophagales bacterium]|nr:UbiA family prenyltransferase [Chitinophagaceae bacterium]MCB9064795.1 UbiA family prenyltransferase [Chitinophagales bacterium]
MPGFVYKLIDWLLYTSIFAASCALGLCMATESLLLNEVPAIYSSLHLLVFCSTLFVYNTHYIIKKSTPELSDRFGWSQKNGLWHYLFLIIGIGGCVFSVFSLPNEILIACGVLGLLSFSYSIPLLPFKDKKKRLKDFGWIKILVLAAVWAIVTSILPILYYHQEMADYPYEILMRFVFMFTLCVAFDIRDMQTDMDEGIATLPNMIGVRGSYGVMSFAMILFVIMSVGQYVRYPSLGRLVAELMVALATKLAVDYAKKHPSDRAYLGLVDGMMLLYALLILLQ